MRYYPLPAQYAAGRRSINVVFYLDSYSFLC